jgi:hypothetical protein
MDKLEWEKEWLDMPEYNNVKEEDPAVEVKIRFKKVEDYIEFHELLKKHLYQGKKVFDGMQKKDKKYTWYPLKEKASKYTYEGTSNPQFPIYIVSKGRWERNPTSKILKAMKVPFKMIVEEEQYKEYCTLIAKEDLLILPKQFKKDYDQFWKDQDDRTGPGAARNFAWEHSIQQGHKWHWVLDDNIESFEIYNNNLKIRCMSGSIFKIMEDFVLRYTNVAIAGPNYAIFCPQSEGRPPFKLNTRIYSCLLIRNDLPYRWRGRYNEDTDLSIRALQDGWCTIQFNAYLQGKRATQTVKGGCDAEFYEKEGTLNKSKILVDMHPEVCRLTKKWNRWHHHCDYNLFKNNKLIRNKSYTSTNRINNFDLYLKNNLK